MASGPRPSHVAGVTALLGVAALAAVGYRIATYEPPNDGGTSIAGLFFAVALLVGLVALVQAGLLAAFTRWVPSAVWPRRALVGAALAACGGSLASVLFSVGAVLPDGSPVAELLAPVGGSLFDTSLLLSGVAVVGSALALAGVVVTAVREAW